MSAFLFSGKKYIYTVHSLQKQFCAISNFSRDTLFFFNRRKSSLGIIVSEDESTAVMEGMTYGNM